MLHKGFSLCSSEEQLPLSFPSQTGSTCSKGNCFALLLQDEARTLNPFSLYRDDKTIFQGEGEEEKL